MQGWLGRSEIKSPGFRASGCRVRGSAERLGVQGPERLKPAPETLESVLKLRRLGQEPWMRYAKYSYGSLFERSHTISEAVESSKASQTDRQTLNPFRV